MVSTHILHQQIIKDQLYNLDLVSSNSIFNGMTNRMKIIEMKAQYWFYEQSYHAKISVHSKIEDDETMHSLKNKNEIPSQLISDTQERSRK